VPTVRNPRYKGTAPFLDLEIDRRTFFGRERERRSLLSLVLAERLVVLFAKSGLGKTSLINAGLVEPLRASGYLPLPVRLADQDNGPIRSVVDGIERAVRDARVDRVGGDPASLWHFFKTAEFWSESDDPLRPVLILDQFEELFTLHGPERRREFISGFAELVRGPQGGGTVGPRRPEGDRHLTEAPPDLKIVLSLREDFLADLEDLARDVPGILHHRFRLGPLTREDARAAIVGPARLDDVAFETRPFAYREEAVEEVLAFLAKQRHGAETVESDEVEPVQLQLICQYLEEQVRERQTPITGGREFEISEADVGGERHMQRVLEGFYDRTLAAIGSPFERREVRRLCERRLISSSGRRLTEDEEEIRRLYKVSEKRLRQLVDARLLRAEPRLGGTFYELSHDTLVKPILQSRKKRRTRWRRIVAGTAGLMLLTAFTVLWWNIEATRRAERVSVLLQQIESGALRGEALLDTSEDLLSHLKKNPDDLRAIGTASWALDYFAAHRPGLAPRARDLREKDLASLRRIPPPPPTLDPGWVTAPAGSFRMGSHPGEELSYEPDADELPAHEVTLSAFRMSAHEVTNAEYRRLVPGHEGDDDLPVVNVNWFEAYAYAAWLGGRLPTEAEWEYAARAGCPSDYCVKVDGEIREASLEEVGWFDENSEHLLHPVREKPANPWGLHDMYGNAWEWTADWYGPYSAEPQVDPWGPPSGVNRVVRGGSFGDDALWARAANRSRRFPEVVNEYLGFRVVLPAAPSS